MYKREYCAQSREYFSEKINIVRHFKFLKYFVIFALYAKSSRYYMK